MAMMLHRNANRSETQQLAEVALRVQPATFYYSVERNGQQIGAASSALDLGIHFQAILPQQMIGETELGRAGAEAYAKRKGVSVEAFLAGFGAPMSPRKVGDHVVSILTDPKYANGVAFGLKGDTGIVSLDT